MRAGGYLVEEAWERALRCAVAGLDVRPLSGIRNTDGSSLSAPSETLDITMASA